MLIPIRPTNYPQMRLLQPAIEKGLADRFQARGLDLYDRPWFFIKQQWQDCSAWDGEIHRDPSTRGEGHFTQTGDQSAIGAVMIGKQQPLFIQQLDGLEEGPQKFRPVQIGGRAAGSRMDLRQGGGAPAVSSPPEIGGEQQG